MIQTNREMIVYMKFISPTYYMYTHDVRSPIVLQEAQVITGYTNTQAMFLETLLPNHTANSFFLFEN